MPRFDIGPAAEFESRDGGIGTGGLVRNGFLEEDEGVWSWQRPALSSGQAAPFSGTALGMLVLGTGLYGLGHNGTASSFTIEIKFNTSATLFTLVAGTIDGGVFGRDTPPPVGSVDPASWKGLSVAQLFSDTGGSPYTRLAFEGSMSTSSLTAFSVGVSTLTLAAGSAHPSGTAWQWGGVAIIPTGGIHTGAFR